VRNVGVENVIKSSDNIELSYNHETRDFDYLIGKILRERNLVRIGVIIAIDYFHDGYHHDNAVAVLDNGKRINCRKLVKR